MSSARIAGALAMCCVVFTFFLFLFPLSYGPTTALRSKQAAEVIFLCIVFCGSLMVRLAAFIGQSSMVSTLVCRKSCFPSPSLSSILRC
jgi:hypothetical protein